MKISNLILVLLFLWGCQQQPPFDGIIIEGDVKNLPDGKIYLTEAHYSNKPLYSTESKDGHFIFKIKTDSSFTPFMAAIRFPDPSVTNKTGTLQFRNHMLGPDSTNHFADAFYLENGYTKIEGDRNTIPYLRIFAGRETDLLYKYGNIDFGWPGHVDAANRSSGVQYIQMLIKNFPFSHFLLQSIYNEKEQYSKDEIKQILALFNTNVLQSKTGSRFTTYLKNRPDPNEPLPNLALADSADRQHVIIDTNARLTLLAFWASWCGPCRKEIPVLKQIHTAFKKKGVKLVSISIDQRKADWLRALRQEKMRWPQYIVDETNAEQVKQQFNFSSIPLLVFTNKNRKEIKRMTGYNPEEKKILDSTINAILGSK